MSTPIHETTIDELKLLTARDQKASDELAVDISQLRIDMTNGVSPPSNTLDLMEQSNKEITRDLNLHMDTIDAKGDKKDATDREMLRALNARVNVRDELSMRLAELRDLRLSVRSSKTEPFGYTAEKTADEAPPEPERRVEPERVVRNDHEQVPNQGDYVDDYDGTESERSFSVYSQNDEEEPEIDKSAWPLLYQVMDVDPRTSNADIAAVLNRYVPLTVTAQMHYTDTW